MKHFLYLFFLSFLLSLNAQVNAQKIQRVEPAFWWAGMVNPELQLLVKGQDIAGLQVAIEQKKGIDLVSVMRLQNANYLVINLRLAPGVMPQKFAIRFNQNQKTVYTYDH